VAVEPEPVVPEHRLDAAGDPEEDEAGDGEGGPEQQEQAQTRRELVCGHRRGDHEDPADEPEQTDVRGGEPEHAQFAAVEFEEDVVGRARVAFGRVAALAPADQLLEPGGLLPADVAQARLRLAAPAGGFEAQLRDSEHALDHVLCDVDVLDALEGDLAFPPGEDAGVDVEGVAVEPVLVGPDVRGFPGPDHQDAEDEKGEQLREVHPARTARGDEQGEDEDPDDPDAVLGDPVRDRAVV
jgi:hypothetical protein